MKNLFETNVIPKLHLLVVQQYTLMLVAPTAVPTAFSTQEDAQDL